MKRSLWIASFILTACVAFAIGWRIERVRTKNRENVSSPPPVGKTQSEEIAGCNDDAPEDRWRAVRTFEFSPIKTSYMVDWQSCSSDLMGARVRVLDIDVKKVLFEYKDDVIVRTEMVELLEKRELQLLIVTESAGTNDRFDWHVLSEVDDHLKEWSWPDYDAPAEKLLRADEGFCCKEWNLHLQGKKIVLARGIYHKDVDGNCCPSRGGILVWLKPVQEGFRVESVRRISKQEYERRNREPFCAQCTLVGP